LQPPTFLHPRTLKELQVRFADLRILKDLAKLCRIAG
jgi:hypothetical protein